MAIKLNIVTAFDDRELKRAQREIGAIGKSLSRGLDMAVLGGLAAMGAGLAKSVESLARIETINTQTETVIKSMGDAAGISAKQVEGLAGELENLTATEAETIQQGANLLLTFGNIKNAAGAGNDIFNQTVKAMVDMGRAMGTDASSSAIQLGKALNDPTKGIAALTRVGVSFTQQQKDQIKALQESGDMMGAQKIILSELQNQFGGSGAAYAKTFSGQMELMKHELGTMGEEIATTVMPAMQGFVDAVRKAIPEIGPKLKAAVESVDWGAVISAIAMVVTNLDKIAFTVGTLWAATKVFAAIEIGIKAAAVATAIFNGTLKLNPIMLAITGVATLALAIKGLYDIASKIPTQRETAGVPAAVAKAATEAGVKAYKAAMKNSSDIQGAIEAKRKATANVVQAYRSQQAEAARLTGAAEAFQGAKLLNTDPLAGLLTPGSNGSGGASAATKTVTTFYDTLLEENRKQMARIRLEKVGVTGTLAEALIGSGETWYATVQGVLKATGPALDELKKKWALTGGEIAAAAQAAADKLAEENAKIEAANKALLESLTNELADAQAKLTDLENTLTPVAKTVIEVYNEAKQAYDSLVESSAQFAKGIPDLVNGIKTMTQLAAPIGQFESQVVSSFGNVEASLKSALDSKLITDASYRDLSAWAKREMALMQDIARQRDALAEKISLAEAVYNDSKNAILAYGNINGLIKTTTQTITESQTKIVGGVTTTLQKSVELISKTNIVDEYRNILKKTKEFAANLNQLKKMGLNKDLFKQIVDAGVDAGGATAQGIIEGGQQSVTELNGIFAELNSVGDAVAETTTVVMFNNGVDVMGGFINGMKAQAEALAATAAGLATTFAEAFGIALKSALQIAIDDAKAALNAAIAALQSEINAAKAELARIQGEIGKVGAPVVAVPVPVVTAPIVDNTGDYIPVARGVLANRNGSTVVDGTTVNLTVNAGLGTNGAQLGGQIVELIKKYEKSSGAVFA